LTEKNLLGGFGIDSREESHGSEVQVSGVESGTGKKSSETRDLKLLPSLRLMLRWCGYQVLLTGEPALVSLAAMLLEVVLEHNRPALAALYQTGLFFFALAYCGSNLVEIGRLFKVVLLLYRPFLPG